MYLRAKIKIGLNENMKDGTTFLLATHFKWDSVYSTIGVQNFVKPVTKILNI